MAWLPCRHCGFTAASAGRSPPYLTPLPWSCSMLYCCSFCRCPTHLAARAPDQVCKSGCFAALPGQCWPGHAVMSHAAAVPVPVSSVARPLSHSLWLPEHMQLSVSVGGASACPACLGPVCRERRICLNAPRAECVAEMHQCRLLLCSAIIRQQPALCTPSHLSPQQGCLRHHHVDGCTNPPTCWAPALALPACRTPTWVSGYGRETHVSLSVPTSPHTHTCTGGPLQGHLEQCSSGQAWGSFPAAALEPAAQGPEAVP